MPIVTSVLLFLLAVVVSAFVARLLPRRVPLPLLQIAIGASLSWVGLGVRLDAELFLLLLIPPLLFLDGWRIPKGALFSDWRPILALAVGLVVFTVVGLGIFIEWLVPAMPLAVAFALAAILSPTDPVAVAAMTSGTPLPSRLTHVLEGEALLNDATGLVCFNFAVAAALTGQFSLAHASASFALVAGGGVLAGVAVTWAIGWLNRRLVRRTGEEPGIQILISLLMPFAAYLVAEEIHVSGVLAAAVAGIAMHYGEMSGRRLPATRVQRNAVWNTVQLTLNGIVFLLLGEQLPTVLRTLPESAAAAGVRSGWHLAGCVVAITLALAALRFAWVWVSLRLTAFRAAADGSARPLPEARLVAVTAAAGVRGAITLAGILTLPFLLPDGTPFPARQAAVFLAMGVILLSLLLASVALPLCARGLVADLPSRAPSPAAHAARIASTEAAIRRVQALAARATGDREADALRADAAAQVLEIYQRRLEDDDARGERQARTQQLTRELRMEGLRAARDELFRLLRARSIDDTVHRQLVAELDLLEASLEQAP